VCGGLRYKKKKNKEGKGNVTGVRISPGLSSEDQRQTRAGLPAEDLDFIVQLTSAGPMLASSW
jgi:hypothetical protein